MNSDWKETAWNGIRFRNPADWLPVEIGNRYLVLEDDTGPVMEIKWEPIKGTFSHEKHFRRLSALHRKRFGNGIRQCQMPTGWKKALNGYEASGFTWTGGIITGKGVILFCPRCRNATLIQFHQRDDADVKSSCRNVLASFRDHSTGGQTVWSIFDIRAVIPDDFRLVQHRFKPGEFTITLAADQLRISLHRWSPATVLLSGRDLEQFARTIAGIPERMQNSENHHMLRWDAAPSPVSGWSRWFSRTRWKSRLLGFRIWHEKAKNRILGIRVEGKKPPDPRIMENITAGYEST